MGNKNSEYLLIHPVRRSDPKSKKFWEGNWLITNVEMKAGSFAGKIVASLRTDEFYRFYQELSSLYITIPGKASFLSMEDWLEIRIKGDGKGNFTADCDAKDQSGAGSFLKFRLQLDYTHIPDILSGLEEILKKFPVIGKPEG
ncbi:MAG: hypothetical protein HY036_01640 [Nitrospirae bacterium]|nr:hypothetical protein [Nitrospirota bacterium]